MSSLSKSIRIDSWDKPDDDIVVLRGSYLQLDYTVYESDGSTALDISSDTVRFTCWDIEAEAEEFALDTGTVTEVEITSGTDGEFSVYLTDSETDTDAKTYLYDIHIVLGSGTEHHAASGKFRIYPTPYTGP